MTVGKSDTLFFDPRTTTYKTIGIPGTKTTLDKDHEEKALKAQINKGHNQYVNQLKPQTNANAQPRESVANPNGNPLDADGGFEEDTVSLAPSDTPVHVSADAQRLSSSANSGGFEEDAKSVASCGTSLDINSNASHASHVSAATEATDQSEMPSDITQEHLDASVLEELNLLSNPGPNEVALPPNTMTSDQSKSETTHTSNSFEPGVEFIPSTDTLVYVSPDAQQSSSSANLDGFSESVVSLPSCRTSLDINSNASHVSDAAEATGHVEVQESKELKSDDNLSLTANEVALGNTITREQLCEILTNYNGRRSWFTFFSRSATYHALNNLLQNNNIESFSKDRIYEALKPKPKPLSFFVIVFRCLFTQRNVDSENQPFKPEVKFTKQSALFSVKTHSNSYRLLEELDLNLESKCSY